MFEPGRIAERSSFKKGVAMARTGGRQRSSGGARVEEESELFVRALARGLSVLALFDIEHPEWGLNEICEQTKISKTTAYRMLRTLEAKDFLAYDAVTEKYHLGRANIPMAYLALSYVGFVRAAHPFLEELAVATDETVELSVAGAAGSVVVDQVATKYPFRLSLPTGRTSNNLAQSAWRLQVAHMSPSERDKVLDRPTYRFAGGLITREEMIRRLDADKVAGVSVDIEELDRGVCAASAPVFERDGTVKATLTIVAPAERFNGPDRDRQIEALKNVAAKIGKTLSGQPLND
jgi:IclR family transcriptional regulator, KDG regulon repressor